MPAEPQTVALYLGHLAADGKAIATIAQARAAISHAHAAQGIPKGDNPARHPVVAETMKGWRSQAPAPKQADALTADALAGIRETARLPRRGRGSRTETTAMAQARGTVDLAIIGVMADAGLRRSEAAALTWTDIEFWPDGTARLTIRKGKNQPEPATVAITETTARALRGIQPDGTEPPCRPCSGVRPDRRDAGQPDTCRSKSCQPGQRLLRAQRPDRHGPEDGGRGSAQRGGPAPGPVEARRHGGPLHTGRSGGRGPEMADLIRPELVRPPPYADNPAASAMTDNAPLCDCPEPCACYAEGYAQGITTGDLVRYTHPADGTVTGYATMTNGNTRADASGKKGMKLQAVTLLERGNGYRYGRGPNETPKRD